MPSSPTRLPERPVYQSLVRVPRYAGVDRSFLVLEVTLVVCLVYLMGISVASVVVVAVVVAGGGGEKAGRYATMKTP